MKIEEGISLQPYGKDDVSVNFLVSPMGKWIFCPTDVSKINTLKENSLIFNYVRFRGQNPKYYIRPINTNFKIKEIKENKKFNLTHTNNKCNSIFFFLFYEPKEKLVAMNYTTKEKEFDIIDEKMNIISLIAFFGKNIEILDQEWDNGIVVNEDNIRNGLISMEN